MVVAAVSVAAAGAAALIGRLRSTPGTGPALHLGAPPDRVDRRDFPSDSEWLLVVFTSVGCSACERTMTAARELAAEDLEVLEVTREESGELHTRYGIDAVPTLLFVDSTGRVPRSLLGSPSTRELASARAQLTVG